MSLITPKQITEKLLAVGVQSIPDDKKVRLYAEVNHRANFTLVYANHATKAMLDAVCDVLDGPENENRDVWMDWFNNACTRVCRLNNCSCFDSLSRIATKMAYAKLHPERCKPETK